MAECRSCGAEITWVTTKHGKQIPRNAKPRRLNLGESGMAVEDDGTIRRITNDSPGFFKEIYESHFATCPNAGIWRKK